MSFERPCRCERYSPTGEYTLDQCRLCWLYHHDDRYHALWGGEDGPGPMARVFQFVRAVSRHAALGLPLVAPEVKAARLAVCKDCDRYQGDRCRECGCNINVKAAWASQDCPKGKWPKES